MIEAPIQPVIEAVIIRDFASARGESTIVPPAHSPSILLESGDYLLLESGDTILLE